MNRLSKLMIVNLSNESMDSIASQTTQMSAPKRAWMIQINCVRVRNQSYEWTMSKWVSSAGVVGLYMDHAVWAPLHVLDGLSVRPKVERSRTRTTIISGNISRAHLSDQIYPCFFDPTGCSKWPTSLTEHLGHLPNHSLNPYSPFIFMYSTTISKVWKDGNNTNNENDMIARQEMFHAVPN